MHSFEADRGDGAKGKGCPGWSFPSSAWENNQHIKSLDQGRQWRPRRTLGLVRWFCHGSVRKTNDLCELEVRGVKPFYLMKLKRWSETGVPTELHSVIHTDTLSLTNENSSSRV
jgi:hypothetical protein